jgi:3-methyladenine DNA glycosylase AlkD
MKTLNHDPATVTKAIVNEIENLQVKNTPEIRKIRRRYSNLLVNASPKVILGAAIHLIRDYGYRGTAYELVRYHKATFQSLGEEEITLLGQGIDSWGAVDSFARILAGPAWLKGMLDDGVIVCWARSEDLWWRRAALVCTVALNVRSSGGYGDVQRTLAICRMLVDDREDMVVKALSWALRVLVVHDPIAVQHFLVEHDQSLASRIRREVRNKLRTGLKNP